MNAYPPDPALIKPERLTEISPGSGRTAPASLGNRHRFSCALKGRGKAFTLVEVLVVIVMLALLGLLALMPGYVRAKAKAQQISCCSRLKNVGLAFRIWAGDHTNSAPMQISTNFGGTKEFTGVGEFYRHYQVMSNEVNVALLLHCPADRQRRPAPSWSALSNSNISYFIGLDADETEPQMFLSGDSNLEVDGKRVGPGLLSLWTNSTVGWTAARHVRQGNIALADGSVQQYSNTKLGQALAVTGVATNRMVIP